MWRRQIRTPSRKSQSERIVSDVKVVITATATTWEHMCGFVKVASRLKI
jgi:hypothetical protein